VSASTTSARPAKRCKLDHDAGIDAPSAGIRSRRRSSPCRQAPAPRIASTRATASSSATIPVLRLDDSAPRGHSLVEAAPANRSQPLVEHERNTDTVPPLDSATTSAAPASAARSSRTKRPPRPLQPAAQAGSGSARIAERLARSVARRAARVTERHVHKTNLGGVSGLPRSHTAALLALYRAWAESRLIGTLAPDARTSRPNQ
jgi:hypothetical protein